MSEKIDLDKMTPAEIKSWLVVAARDAMLESRRNAVVQVDVLLDANWKFEIPEIVNGCSYETEPWQWYWRSPPKRKGSKGQKYHSTNQAFNAMKRHQPHNPK